MSPENGNQEATTPTKQKVKKMLKTKPRSRKTNSAGTETTAFVEDRRQERVQILKAKMRARLQNSNLANLFNQFDLDGNGSITKHELKSGFEKQGAALLSGLINRTS
jgi:hypothetical protein